MSASAATVPGRTPPSAPAGWVAAARALPFLALLVAGCGPAPHTRGAGALSPLAVRAVDYNPSRAPLGRVRAVAEADDVVAVFAADRATILAAGAVVATDPGDAGWVAAAAIPAPAGGAPWIVGVDGRGELQHLHGRSAFEDVSARFALGRDALREVAALDARGVAFRLDGGVSVADGRHVTRYAVPALSALAAGGGRTAAIAGGRVVVLDPGQATARVYALPGVREVAVGPTGRVYAATSRALFAASPAFDLELLYDAEHDTLHGLVASGDRVWFGDGPELGMIEGERVSETAGAALAPDARLATSPDGDVWVIARGELRRFTTAAGPAGGTDAAWSAAVGPVFARSCADCHAPGGVSGTDLSTPEAWARERDAIRERVVVRRSMPPDGHPLSEADRQAIRAWLDGAL